jgi:hypothetical protein
MVYAVHTNGLGRYKVFANCMLNASNMQANNAQYTSSDNMHPPQIEESVGKSIRKLGWRWFAVVVVLMKPNRRQNRPLPKIIAISTIIRERAHQLYCTTTSSTTVPRTVVSDLCSSLEKLCVVFTRVRNREL